MKVVHVHQTQRGQGGVGINQNIRGRSHETEIVDIQGCQQWVGGDHNRAAQGGHAPADDLGQHQIRSDVEGKFVVGNRKNDLLQVGVGSDNRARGGFEAWKDQRRQALLLEISSDPGIS